MTTATHTITVDVPVSVAYDQWTQMESYPRFMTGVRSVEQLDAVRTRWHEVVGGFTRMYTAQVVDQVPDSHIAWHAEDDPEQAGLVQFTPTRDGATEIELSLAFPTDVLSTTQEAMLRLDDAHVRDTLEAFKALIEAQGEADGAWRGEIHGGAAQRSAHSDLP